MGSKLGIDIWSKPCNRERSILNENTLCTALT